MARYQTRRVVGALASELRNLRTIGLISTVVYKKALNSYNYARKVVSSYKGKSVQAAAPYKKANVQKIQKDIREIKKSLDTQTALFTRKRMATTSLTIAAVGQAKYGWININGKDIIEDAINSVKFFDPDVPGTLQNVDLTAPAFQNEVRLTKVFGGFDCMNNYKVPVKFSYYFVLPKIDTNENPQNAVSNGFTDISDGSNTDVLLYPSDSQLFSKLWKTVKSGTKLLYPGQMCSDGYSVKDILYDNSLVDTHTTTHQMKLKSLAILIRVEGVPCHDSVTGNITLSRGGVDIVYRRYHTVQYPGGADIKYIEVSNGLQAIANTPQVSLKNVEQETYGL